MGLIGPNLTLFVGHLSNVGSFVLLNFRQFCACSLGFAAGASQIRNVEFNDLGRVSRIETRRWPETPKTFRIGKRPRQQYTPCSQRWAKTTLSKGEEQLRKFFLRKRGVDGSIVNPFLPLFVVFWYFRHAFFWNCVVQRKQTSEIHTYYTIFTYLESWL